MALEARYLNACRKHEVQPNSSILSSCLKVKNQRMCQELCVLEIFVDQLVNSDFPPLIDALSDIHLSGIDAIDVHQGSSDLQLEGEYVLSLLHAVNCKLRVVELIDWSYWKNLCDIFQGGLACCALYLQSSPMRKLNITGNFLQLQTLNLDFSLSLTSFHISCFSCMPKLMHLSMCGTRVTNLSMACASLSKLQSLIELRFQNGLCCSDTGPCPTSGKASSSALSYEDMDKSSNPNVRICNANENVVDLNADVDSLTNYELLQSITDESSDLSDLDFSNNHLDGDDFTKFDHQISSEFMEEILLSSTKVKLDTDEIDGHEYPYDNSFSGHATAGKVGSMLTQKSLLASIHVKDLDRFFPTSPKTTDGKGCFKFSPRQYASHHPSPICFDKYYREYMISSLPCLKVLDNLSVSNTERENANLIFKKHYEFLPYNRQHKESVVSILLTREVGSNIFHRKVKPSQSLRHFSRGNCHSISRSISAAKVSSSPWPLLHLVSTLRNGLGEEIMAFNPRQFEYHPCNPSLMAFGTLDGELVVINHESQKLVGYLPSVGSLHSILGLCWLKSNPSKLIVGSDNGSLRLYDVCKMPSRVAVQYRSKDAAIHNFDEFEQLTSLSINSTDEYFIASGFSKHVALYDICSGKRLQILKDLHQEHINVVRFAHHSPTIFSTASFDRKVKMWDLRQGTSQPCYTASSSRGNVMVCFSPDDHYLLVSAIDNEVKQLLAVDGHLHTAFNIASVGSNQNYTRSYYMNGRDYIISGSCEENVVRVCCAQTGRRLRDISFEGKSSRSSMFVQSLRGDPFRVFHLSVLAAYSGHRSKPEIIKVNLLSSGDCQ
ncbi:hypothetical protein J5N97_010342 [Dioscorea zingiberensis]|uniref:DWD hypersensitive to UV-B 1 N-terminal domain-containing protein n=1 Tax=Dioscorea zingiberensis TaxID=325984 RepID=A0A9D5CZZ4_9LILI|nr:hypothetical protein J5N97_010342 [Dioscorea zingiberensis]